MRRPDESVATEGVIAASFDAAAALSDEAVAIEQATESPADALRKLVGLFGQRGLLSLVVRERDGGFHEQVSSRALCLARERLAYGSPLLDLAFAMQGLGSYPITHSQSEAMRPWLRKVAGGEAVAAFALTEPEAGSDLNGLSTSAQRAGDGYVLDGHKTFISNAGIADLYVVFAATAPRGSKRRVSAFVVDAKTPGVTTSPLSVLGGHPIGDVWLRNAKIPAENRLGEEGDGLSIALATLSKFRPTVGAAAVGFAQRALDEALNHVKTRHQFGGPLAAREAVQLRLAEMECDIEAARQLVYRAARLAESGWWKGTTAASREDIAHAASMAKLVATENAQRVVDAAVQLHGGKGVLHGSIVARLYEDVRALRIYEGASDVQKLLIARRLLES